MARAEEGSVTLEERHSGYKAGNSRTEGDLWKDLN